MKNLIFLVVFFLGCNDHRSPAAYFAQRDVKVKEAKWQIPVYRYLLAYDASTLPPFVGPVTVEVFEGAFTGLDVLPPGSLAPGALGATARGGRLVQVVACRNYTPDGLFICLTLDGLPHELVHVAAYDGGDASGAYGPFWPSNYWHNPRAPWVTAAKVSDVVGQSLLNDPNYISRGATLMGE